jgi:membrane-associated protease RseP (regulator of RpoE activity)
MLLRTLYRLAAVGALILMPASVLAQRADARVGQASPGWIGISIDVRTQTSSDGVRATVVITDVNERSPARAAGLRAGDVLLRINDIRDVRGFENVASRLHLDPGDPVHIVYVRDGRRRQINLTAGDRSRPVSTPVYTFRFQPDSMVEAAFRTINSLRVRLVQARGRNVPLVDPAPVPDPAISRIRAREVLEVQAPFAFFVFPGEQHDSLQREMDELNSAFREVTARQKERLRDLMRISGTLRGNEDDLQLVQIRGTLEDLTRRSLRLRKAMEEATVVNAGNRYTMSFSRGREREPRAEFRPLAPYLLGQNRAVGAEMIDLRSELAAYFQVDGGVLVTDVPNKTPAAAAGIKPGDVITRIDHVAVRSVQGLRLALSRAEATIPLTLVRQGTTMTVLLRR